MKKTSLFFIALLLLVPGLIAQKNLKPWDQWNKKDAEKILNNSGWGQTQTEMLSSQTLIAGAGLDNRQSNVDFHIRFLTAKPLKQAFARTLMLTQKLPPDAEKSLIAFTEQKAGDQIVVAVVYECPEVRLLSPIDERFARLVTAEIQNNTFLEVGKKRVFLTQYSAPNRQDGLGAKFFFPRTVDGQPLIAGTTGEVRFMSDIKISNNYTLKLNMRFKIADMMYEGNLEY